MEIQKLITVITKVLQLQNPLNLIKRIFFENFAVGNARLPGNENSCGKNTCQKWMSKNWPT